MIESIIDHDNSPLAVGHFPDWYPFRSWAMFAGVDAGTEGGETVYWRAQMADGSVRPLGPPISRFAALTMVWSGDFDKLTELALVAGRGVEGAQSVMLVYERVHIAAYPADPVAVVTDRREILNVPLDGVAP